MSDVHDLAERIERSWKAHADGDPLDAEAVETAIGLLDRGEIRVAEPDGDGGWTVNQWVKQAVLLYFRVRGMTSTESGPFEYHDKLPLKHGYDELDVRVVPPATTRYGAFRERGHLQAKRIRPVGLLNHRSAYPLRTQQRCQARERFINELQGLKEGEDPAPHIQNFLPAILPALKLGIRFRGM